MRLYETTNVAEVLKCLREKQNLSRTQLAEKLHCSRDTIRRIEKGEHKPNYIIFCRWARACGQQLIIRSVEQEVKPIEMTDTKQQMQSEF